MLARHDDKEPSISGQARNTPLRPSYSVELANATLYSALTGQTIELPLDGAAYERKLQQLIAESKFEKKVVEAKVEDFSKSFNR